MPPPPELSPEVLRRALAGDDEAFAELVSVYRLRLLRTSLSILVNRSDAEEVVQNVFIRFHRYSSSYDPSRPLSAYLHRIAVLESYRVLAGRKRDREVSEADLVGAGWFQPGRSATQGMLDRERMEAIEQALGTLTERERVCFVLRDVEEMDSAQVAETLGISPVTVRRFCGIARGKIADALRQRFGRPEELLPGDRGKS